MQIVLDKWPKHGFIDHLLSLRCSRVSQLRGWPDMIIFRVTITCPGCCGWVSSIPRRTLLDTWSDFTDNISTWRVNMYQSKRDPISLDRYMFIDSSLPDKQGNCLKKYSYWKSKRWAQASDTWKLVNKVGWDEPAQTTSILREREHLVHAPEQCASSHGPVEIRLVLVRV